MVMLRAKVTNREGGINRWNKNVNNLISDTFETSGLLRIIIRHMLIDANNRKFKMESMLILESYSYEEIGVVEFKGDGVFTVKRTKKPNKCKSIW